MTPLSIKIAVTLISVGVVLFFVGMLTETMSRYSQFWEKIANAGIFLFGSGVIIVVIKFITVVWTS